MPRSLPVSLQERICGWRGDTLSVKCEFFVRQTPGDPTSPSVPLDLTPYGTPLAQLREVSPGRVAAIFSVSSLSAPASGLLYLDLTSEQTSRLRGTLYGFDLKMVDETQTPPRVKTLITADVEFDGNYTR